MGNLDSRSQRSRVCTETIAREVRNVQRAAGMSDRDRKLFNFAKWKIAEEDLEDTEVTISFQDQAPITICATNKPSAKVWMGYKHNRPQMIWMWRGVLRTVRSFFIDSFKTLRRALLKELAIGASGALKKAIGWK